MTAPAAAPIGATASKQIFVNLPVKDAKRSLAFFRALGFGDEPKFTDDKACCIVLGERQFAMMLAEPFFQGFIDTPIADGRTSSEVIVCLELGSRAQVDAVVAKAVANGATAAQPPMDHGFMYLNRFRDLDGHRWELIHVSGEPPAA